MRVIRFSSIDKELKIEKEPFQLNYEGELIFSFDQSSTCTALTIGTKDKQIKELITFEREKRQGETIEGFLARMGEWIKHLMVNVNVSAFSMEEIVHTSYVMSDRITKQVRGKLLDVYQTSKCTVDGKYVKVSENATLIVINNKEWKALIVPREMFRVYKDDKIAVHRFVGKFLPVVARMEQDIADSVCMYLFIIQTRYGAGKLTAHKSTIKHDHSVVIQCFPFEELRRGSKELVALADDVLSSTFNAKQLEFMSAFRKQYATKWVKHIVGQSYVGEEIQNYTERIEELANKYLSFRHDRNEIQFEYEYFNRKLDAPNLELIEFEYSQELDLEENVRSFTSRDDSVYFCVLNRSLPYCYIIPTFDLILAPEDKILVMATKYKER